MGMANVGITNLNSLSRQQTCRVEKQNLYEVQLEIQISQIAAELSKGIN